MSPEDWLDALEKEEEEEEEVVSDEREDDVEEASDEAEDDSCAWVRSGAVRRVRTASVIREGIKKYGKSGGHALRRVEGKPLIILPVSM